MSNLNRRSFLGATAVAGLAAVAGAGAATADTGRRIQVPLIREDHRVIVVGSGFGGGVAALRLAQAGVPVLVLERGKRWPTSPNADTFPNATAPDKRMLWYGSSPNLFGTPVPFDPYVGLLEAVPGDNMTALCAAGVGGGSLIYQGMSLQPSQQVFEEHFPAGLDWTTMNRVHYPRVARMLQLEQAPDALIDTPSYRAARVFADNARRAGLPVSKIPMPIDWNFALDETRGVMTPSYTNGAGALGVNNCGKHSVDVTYIAEAEATGLATVATQHNVSGVERAADGRWVVHVDRIDSDGTVLENKILTTGALIMAAGSLNTTKLLVRAGATGAIADLPDELGQGWGTNADRIYVWTSLEQEFGAPQGGPVVFGSMNWDDPRTAHTVIQASIPPLSFDARSTMLVGYGVSDGRGHFDYDPAGDRVQLRWPANGDHVIQDGSIDPTVRRIAGTRSILTDTNALFPSTWHPLGGANMGAVCDLEGRVQEQPGLYVLDGALMPGNTAACNPSMTIAAIAERALDHILARDLGTVI